jgi:hypothetical protein
MQKQTIPAILTVLAVLLVVIGAATVAETKMIADPYCEMVGLWNSTNGELGWPDYNRNYVQVCPPIPVGEE